MRGLSTKLSQMNVKISFLNKKCYKIKGIRINLDCVLLRCDFVWGCFPVLVWSCLLFRFRMVFVLIFHLCTVVVLFKFADLLRFKFNANSKILKLSTLQIRRHDYSRHLDFVVSCYTQTKGLLPHEWKNQEKKEYAF
jgi:hypothetical protein